MTSIAVAVVTAFFGGLAFQAYGPVSHKIRAVGVGAVFNDQTNIHGESIVQIPQTLKCEDLHHHKSSNLIFAACDDEDLGPVARTKWFPPMTLFDHNWSHGRGRLVSIDPVSLRATNLKLEGFRGAFITHGIDIWEDPANPTKISIFAVNHVAHPNAASSEQTVKAASRIEVFEHTIKSGKAKWIRSVEHPLVQMPNDLLITGPNSFYVTNDHYYREGFLRKLEDFTFRQITPWTTTVHVTFDRKLVTADPKAGVDAEVVLRGLHNNNGLGHGSFPDEVVILSAASGEVTRAIRSADPADRQLRVLEHFDMDSTLDNPSFFLDDYATPSNNASGYVFAGCARAITLFEDAQDPDANIPSVVWHVKPKDRSVDIKDAQGWEKTQIFRDGGQKLSSASTAVIVGIDPAKTGGRKQGLLFASGPFSRHVIATHIDL